MRHLLSILSLHISLPRLAIGTVAVAGLFGVLYFAVGDSQDRSVSSATLLDTRPSADAEASVGLEMGDVAPDFEISTPDGDRVRLSDLRGRPVLVNFWAAWCVSCLSEMPVIKELQSDRGVDTFSVLAINTGESRDRALEFIDFLDAPFVFGLDVGLTVTDAYAVYGLPLTVFIDSDGVVRAIYRGATDRKRLETMADAAIFAQEPVDFGPSLRFISPIPRDRLVVATQIGDAELIMRSRSLRCDASYCADSVLDAAGLLVGVLSTEVDQSSSEPALKVRFVPAPGAGQQIAEAVVAMIEALEDPVFEPSQPVTLRFIDES